MKKLILLFLFALQFNCIYSQSYGNMKYMDKDKPIASNFFERLHTEYEYRAQLDSYGSRHQEIFYEIISLLKDKSTTIVVSEAKLINWSSNIVVPYWPDYEKKAKKRDVNKFRAIMYDVVLPVIIESFRGY